MGYYSQGLFTWDILWNMPVHLRRVYLNKLNATKEAEAKAIEEAKKTK